MRVSYHGWCGLSHFNRCVGSPIQMQCVLSHLYRSVGPPIRLNRVLSCLMFIVSSPFELQWGISCLNCIVIPSFGRSGGFPFLNRSVNLHVLCHGRSPIRITVWALLSKQRTGGTQNSSLHRSGPMFLSDSSIASNTYRTYLSVAKGGVIALDTDCLATPGTRTSFLMHNIKSSLLFWLRGSMSWMLWRDVLHLYHVSTSTHSSAHSQPRSINAAARYIINKINK